MSLKVRFRLDGKCIRRPRYNPKRHGGGGGALALLQKANKSALEQLSRRAYDVFVSERCSTTSAGT